MCVLLRYCRAGNRCCHSLCLVSDVVCLVALSFLVQVRVVGVAFVGGVLLYVTVVRLMFVLKRSLGVVSSCDGCFPVSNAGRGPGAGTVFVLYYLPVLVREVEGLSGAFVCGVLFKYVLLFLFVLGYEATCVKNTVLLTACLLSNGHVRHF